MTLGEFILCWMGVIIIGEMAFGFICRAMLDRRIVDRVTETKETNHEQN